MVIKFTISVPEELVSLMDKVRKTKTRSWFIQESIKKNIKLEDLLEGK